MNILFVNYGDFTTNSLNHIGGFANGLCRLGHACIVAVPFKKESLAVVSDPLFIPALYSELLAEPSLFPNRRPADIIHAWTPREGVRKFVVAYQRAAAVPARLVVHLEDNEEYLIASYTRRSMAELKAMSGPELENLIPDSLPHPIRYKNFLRLADSSTVIVDSLREFVPKDVAVHLLPPGVDAFGPFEAIEVRSDLGVGPNEKVIVFTGSNTFANEPEMRELYVAVHLLNQRGMPTRLIRTGFNSPQFLEGLSHELKQNVIDLGFIAKERLPGLLALADVLVQPGKPGPFNDYRLPSKLPEFLASGRPVVLPRTNIALAMTNGKEALFLSSGSPDDIADRCRQLFTEKGLGESLGANAVKFAAKHFDLAARVEQLQLLYRDLAKQPAKAFWQKDRGTAASDLTAGIRLVEETLAASTGKLSDALASFAADLASISLEEEQRAQDERKAFHETRETLSREVNLLRAQTKADSSHFAHLKAVIEDRQKHLRLTRQLTGQHIRNLEKQIESLRAEIVARDTHESLSHREIESLKAVLLSAEARIGELRSRVSEIESVSKDRTAAAWREHAKVAARVMEMDAELNLRDEKIRRLQRSISWRITSPVRDLERLLIRLFGKKTDPKGASVSSSPPVKQEAAAQAGEPKAPEPARYSYTCNFDHPRTWNTTANKLLILGWCFENAGTPIKGIRARYSETVADGIYGSKRLDVLAAHAASRQAEYCGIKLEVPTTLGDHLLTIEVLHADGWNPYFETLVHVGRPGDPTEVSEYERWCRQHETLDEADLKAIKAHIGAMARRPLISVVMPVYNPPKELLEKAVESVRRQIYPHWELCIVDDASTDPAIRPVIEAFAAKDSRIKTAFRPLNGHICAASNTALELSTGDYVALFDHDDILSSAALYEVAALLDAHPDAQFIYTDEDKIDGEDRRFDPYFKPDWNPDLILGQNYTSHLSVFTRSLVKSVGGFRPGYEGSQDWDLTLRVIDQIPTSAIRHIPKVLYHWRAIPGSTALQLAEKNYPLEAARKALVDHFARRKETIELLPVPGDHWRVKYPLPRVPPKVSIIIPTRNAHALVRQAVGSILSTTDYPNFEILIIDNGSDDPEALRYFEAVAKAEGPKVRILAYQAPFNYSAINNFAVKAATGELVALLNNDVEAINKGWLCEMASQALRPGIGAVGAMLYYPINTIQHAGVVLGLGGVAGHPFKETPRGDQGQKNRLRLVQNYSAVTAACLVIRKDRFLEVGGFNEKDLPIAFNDVDLCCKLIKAGYRNLWTPHAEFYHHESATRGTEDTPDKRARFQSEIDYMTRTWGDLLSNDPAYNPNLTLVGEDFSAAYLPRTKKPWTSHLH